MLSFLSELDREQASLRLQTGLATGPCGEAGLPALGEASPAGLAQAPGDH